MNSPETDKTPSIPASFGKLSDTLVEKLYRMSSTGAMLEALYKENNTEKLNETIDELIDELVAEDPEWIENIRKLKELQSLRNKNESAEQAIVARQKELCSMYRVIIVNEAGLPDETRFTEIEQARNAVAKILQEQPKPITDTSAALIVLGIVERHGDQKDFRFPSELMPASVQEKWETYLATVCNHRRLVEHNTTPEENYRINQADITRKYAHDSVTADVNAILDFAKIDPNWTFKDMRLLLGDIGNFIFKDANAYQSPEAQRLLDRHTSSIHASTILSDRYSNHSR